MATLTFNNLSSERLGFWSPIKLKLTTTTLYFKNEKTGKTSHFEADLITDAEWIFRVRGYGLCIKLSNRKRYYFDGFAENEFEKISNYFKENYKVDIKNVETCLKGWNWGKPVFDGEYMEFHTDGKRAFDINLKDINYVNRSKNEIIIQMKCSDEAFSIYEMRFAPVSTQNEELIEEVYDKIKSEADTLVAEGDLAVLEEMKCLQPRGRYEFKIYPKVIHMRGKTYDYNVPKDDFVRFYLLPHPSDNQIFFVLQMNPPITHGQTRYYFIVLLFDKDETMELELNCTEEWLKENYPDGSLSKEMAGPTYEVVTKLLKTVYAQKLTVPIKFESKNKSRAIACIYKTLNGFLYPLEKSFIFVPKPTISIRADEVACVNLNRASIMQRAFEFDIETVHGVVHTFGSVDKGEYQGLLEFIKTKGYKMSSREHGARQENWSDSDDNGEENLFKSMSQGDGTGRRNKPSSFRMNDDDDDDDEDDEDFRPPDDSSVSSVAEEYDSDVSPSSGSSSNESGSEDKKSSSMGAAEAAPAKTKDMIKRQAQKLKKEKVKAKAIEEKPKNTKGSKKRMKDPNAPKKPMTPYMLFAADVRQNITKANPGKSVVEVSKITGEQWKALTDTEKAVYAEKYNENRKKYDEAMKIYLAKGPAATINSPTTGGGGGAGAGGSSGVMFKSEEFVQSSGSSSD